jgi:hypothetical protein
MTDQYPDAALHTVCGLQGPNADRAGRLCTRQDNSPARDGTIPPRAKG